MRLLPVLCLAMPFATPVSADELPLESGYYVADGTDCAEASNATLQLVTRTAFNWPQQACAVGAVVPGDPPAFAVTFDCAETADFPAEQLKVTLTISDRQTYGLSFEGEPPSVMRYCPQSSLPDPWRTNDIGG